MEYGELWKGTVNRGGIFVNWKLIKRRDVFWGSGF